MNNNKNVYDRIAEMKALSKGINEQRMSFMAGKIKRYLHLLRKYRLSLPSFFAELETEIELLEAFFERHKSSISRNEHLFRHLDDLKEVVERYKKKYKDMDFEVDETH